MIGGKGIRRCWQINDIAPGEITETIIEYHMYRTRRKTDKSLIQEVKPGDANGNIFDGCESDHWFKDEWGQAPDRDFRSAPRDADISAIQGYNKLVLQYRAVKSALQNKVDD